PHGGAGSLRDGPRRAAAAVARGRAPAVSHPRTVAGRAGGRLDRADADLDRALVEGFLQPAVHLRGAGGVRLLCHVLRSGDPPAAYGTGPPAAVLDLGRPGHAHRLHSVLTLARVQHGPRAARGRRDERGADPGGAAALLLLETARMTRDLTPCQCRVSRARAAPLPRRAWCPRA